MREVRIFSFPFPLYDHTTMITPKKMNRNDSSTLPCIHLVLSFSLSRRCLFTVGLLELGSKQGSHLGDSGLSLWICSNFASSFFPLPFICWKLRSFVPSSYSGFAWLYPSNVLLHSLYFFWLLLFMGGAVYHISQSVSLVAQSCPTLCDPVNHSTAGLPAHHQFPEFTQTHVHRVSEAIQPSHPLSSPSPPASNPSQHQSLFQWVNSSHEVTKVLEFQL